MSVVIFLQHPVNNLTILRKTNSSNDIDDDRDSNFPMYLLLASDDNQNLMQNLSGLLIYTMKCGKLTSCFMKK
ncbi:hypothetical protein V1477_019435 [Vespula maculifrons]|uniref:Uncharacterized protein n=1 Tax=Vespula maculifrons TaxID=7453 RepID=A0ABD2ASJ3_VESMC